MPNDLLGGIVAAAVTALQGITAGADYHFTPGTVREELKVASLTIEHRPVYAVAVTEYEDTQEGAGFHRAVGTLEVAIVMEAGTETQAADLRKAARDIRRCFAVNERLGGLVHNLGARARFEYDNETSLARGLVVGSVFVDFVHRYDHAAL